MRDPASPESAAPPPTVADLTRAGARSCGFAVLLLAGLASLGCARKASAPDGLVGCFGAELTARGGRANVKNAAVWRICFGADGRYHAATVPGSEIEGRWSVSGDVVLLEDTGGSHSCQSKGVDAGSARYRFRRGVDTLDFALLRDECNARRDALTGRAFQVLP